MGYLEAILMGLIQGITEFLPVSSSGHLEIASKLFGVQSQENLFFTVVLHFATALSTVVIFRKELLALLKKCLKGNKDKGIFFIVKIIISMIPATLVGLFFETEINSLFSGNILLVGFMLLITAILLFLADHTKKHKKNIGFLHALIIGISQAVAILPGISRSGATIATAILLKIDRSKAAYFSFLMVLPLIFGKMAKDILYGEMVFETAHFSHFFAGFIVAFFSGLLACKWMIALVKKSKLTYFAFYCLLVSTLSFAYLLLK